MAIARQADLPLRLKRRLPLTRGDCVDGARPCPHLTCTHHLGTLASGETCVLDMADKGGMSLDEIGEVLGLDSRESVRSIEAQAARKILFAASDGRLDALLDHVDPGWRTADRSAGPSVRVRPREDEPDADDELDQAARDEGEEDTLASHVWAAYLRASNQLERDDDADGPETEAKTKCPAVKAGRSCSTRGAWTRSSRRSGRATHAPPQP